MRETSAFVVVALVVLGVFGCNSGAAEYQLGPAARATTAETPAGGEGLSEAEVPQSTEMALPEETPREAIAGEAPAAEPPTVSTFLGRPASSWIEQLADSWDASQRMAAVSVLMEMGPGVEGVTPALISALGDRDPSVREAATLSLQRFGPQAGDDLRQALYGHPVHSVRAGAARSLAPLAASDAMVLSSLIKATKDRSSLVRRVSVEVIGEAGAEVSAAVPALAEALLDEDPNVRASAAAALGRIGPMAEGAIPALTVASLDAVPRVAAAARDALSKIEGQG